MVEKDKTTKVLNNLPHWLNKESDSNNYKFITSFDTELQDVDDEIIQLKQSIQISTAGGEDLDDIGNLFKLIRDSGESDTNFRTRIKAFWEGAVRGGIKEAITDVFESTTGLTSNDYTYNENADMTVTIDATIPSFSVSLPTVIDVLNDTKAAGVYLFLNLTSKLEDLYKQYEDTIAFTTHADIQTVYIIGDVWQIGDDSVAL